jgi:HK97 gp10 family phage protein
MMTVKMIGGKKLLKKFEKMGDDAPVRFKEVVDDTAYYMRIQAVNHINKNVDTGTGHLKRSMYVKSTSPTSARVGNTATHAPYVEFGTGKYVRVPSELAPIASAVRSRPKRSFEDGLRRIADWLKMKGGDPKNAWPVLMSILRTGVKPRPFFFPAMKMAQRYMRKESAKALKDLANGKN